MTPAATIDTRPSTRRTHHPGAIAHLAAPATPHRALCGAPLEGIQAPQDTDRCVVCSELSGRRD